MIEDESEWLSNLFPYEVIAPDCFFFSLESGVLLCKLAELVQKHAEMYAKENNITVPKVQVKYHQRVRTGSLMGQFLARENVTTFLSWCRAHKIRECILFESNDIVQTDELREGAREVVICLMEIARMAFKYGVKPPKLVLLENEIELEEKEEQKALAVSEPTDLEGRSSPSLSVDSGVETESESVLGRGLKRTDFDDIDGTLTHSSPPGCNSRSDGYLPKSREEREVNKVNNHQKPQSELDKKVGYFSN